MRSGSGVGIVVAVVLGLALVGLVVMRQERRENSSPTPVGTRGSQPSAPRDVEELEPAPEPGSAPNEPSEAEPVADAPDAPKSRRGYRAFAKKNPAGVLEVLVLLAREPLAEATVRVRATQRGELFESPMPGDDERIAFTDRDGLARFEGLPPDYYMVGVQTRDGILVTTHQLVRADRETARQIVALGRSGLLGGVHGLDGQPLVDSRLLVGIDPPAGAARISTLATTDAQGAYRVGGLSEGRGRVYSQLGRSIDVELARDEWKRADFGSPLAPVQWRGALRGITGTPCDAFERVIASETSDGEGYAIAVGSSGRFEVRLPPGSYRLWVPTDPRVELGQVELEAQAGEEAFVHDLTVPGVMLSGRVTAVEQGLDAELEISIERDGDAGSRRTYTTRVGERYAFTALEPGRWNVTTAPVQLLGARAKGLEVTLTEARDRLTLDLLVSQR